MALRRYLRNNSTDAERKLWLRLGHDQLGVRWRRQYGVRPYILDFYCPAAKLAVEVDGSQHYQPKHQRVDENRSAFLAGEKIRVLSFDDVEVLTHRDSVVEQILQAQTLSLALSQREREDGARLSKTARE